MFGKQAVEEEGSYKTSLLCSSNLQSSPNPFCKLLYIVTKCSVKTSSYIDNNYIIDKMQQSHSCQSISLLLTEQPLFVKQPTNVSRSDKIDGSTGLSHHCGSHRMR